MTGTNIGINHPQLHRGGLSVNAAEAADRADVAAEGSLLEGQAQHDGQPKQRQEHPTRHARIGQGQGAEQANQKKSARLQPGAFQPFGPAQVQPQAAPFGEDPALLQPIAGQWDGADAAPGAPAQRDENQLEHAPPGNPDEDDGKVVAAHGSAKQPGGNGEDKARQGQRPHQELRPAAFDHRAQPGDAVQVQSPQAERGLLLGCGGFSQPGDLLKRVHFFNTQAPPSRASAESATARQNSVFCPT